jgi:hypothetical protein
LSMDFCASFASVKDRRFRKETLNDRSEAF